MMKEFHVGIKGVVRVGDTCLVLKANRGGGTYWDVPGGRIDDNESIDETLYRELHEELPSIGGYTLGPVVGAYRLSKNITDDLGLVLIFYRIDAEPFEVELSDEHIEYAWMDTTMLDELLESGVHIEKGYFDALKKALL